MFVKVRSPENEFPFYVEECLLERFPLSWYWEPVQILGMIEENALMIEFLDQYLCSSEPLSLNRLVKLEKENEFASEYLGDGSEPAFEEEQNNSVKRRRQEEEVLEKGQVINLTGNRCYRKEVSLDEVKKFTENQKKLHDYMGE
ncbi:hypothetical protein PIB30_024973 [Stylosanthes scabra]|uniref:Uncharacterized protein n=1 Tax=Stylosanthes scabra TaxID=79078 RepID=A0ABU6X7G2_9FABA|nr:hypothetical protein [Stylosanthes scabra]